MAALNLLMGRRVPLAFTATEFIASNRMIYFKSKQQLLHETLYYSDLFNGVKIVYFSINIFYFTSAVSGKTKWIFAFSCAFISFFLFYPESTEGYFKNGKFMYFPLALGRFSHKHKINLHIENWFFFFRREENLRIYLDIEFQVSLCENILNMKKIRDLKKLNHFSIAKLLKFIRIIRYKMIMILF